MLVINIYWLQKKVCYVYFTYIQYQIYNFYQYTCVDFVNQKLHTINKPYQYRILKIIRNSNPKIYLTIKNISTTLGMSFKNKHKFHQIGPYKYSEKDQIGYGFSSKVYKGINTSNQKPVAIKVINSQILSEQIHNTLLQSELKILQLMKGSENILEMDSIIKKNTDNYIITEICTTDLSKIIIPLLPIEKIEFYFQQLLNGFQQLFRREIIHRDLKPANLLIDSSGNLKIADFGFAIKITQAKNQVKFNIGSPLYMSPQALKRNEYSYKSDIWAIGIILYEMLTGDTPWKAENQQQLYEKLQNIRIDNLLNDKIFPQHMKQFLKKSLQFQRRFRISPQQMLRFRIKNKIQQQIIQNQFQKEQILKTVKTQNNLFIPRLQKSSRTQKFYKPYIQSHTILHKTNTSIKPEPVTINLVTKFNLNQSNSSNITIFDMNKQDTNQKVSDEKQTTRSSAKTNGSTTLAISQQHQQEQKPILTKQQTKNITNNLVYYVHICRLLYKIIVRLDQCIQTNFNTNVTQLLANLRENLKTNYCHFIVKYMYKVKNFINNNFISISRKLHEQYIITSQFKKLRKVCGEYIDRYSKSQQLKYLWVQRQEPDLKACLEATRQLIIILWPQLCQKNHNEVILLQFILFAHEALESLQKGSHEHIRNKNRIQDFVDTIPNPPTFNRFKQAIAGGKKISVLHPIKIKQQKQQ